MKALASFAATANSLGFTPIIAFAVAIAATLALGACAAGIQTPIGGSSVNVAPGYLPPPPPPNYLR